MTPIVAPLDPTQATVDEDAANVVPSAVFEKDATAWRNFVARYDRPLREVVRHATDALQDDQIDDIMGDFWLAVVADDLRLLRSFNPSRGASLLTWLTFHVSHVAHTHVAKFGSEPPIVSLAEARNVPVLPPRSVTKRIAPRLKLPSGRRYSEEERALMDDFAAFLAKLASDGKLDGLDMV